MSVMRPKSRSYADIIIVPSLEDIIQPSPLFVLVREPSEETRRAI